MAFSRTAEVSEFFVFLFDDFNATYVDLVCRAVDLEIGLELLAT